MYDFLKWVKTPEGLDEDIHVFSKSNPAAEGMYGSLLLYYIDILSRPSFLFSLHVVIIWKVTSIQLRSIPIFLFLQYLSKESDDQNVDP